MAAYGIFTFACAFALFYVIKWSLDLRVSADEELEGLDYGEHGMHAYDLGGGMAGSEVGQGLARDGDGAGLSLARLAIHENP